MEVDRLRAALLTSISHDLKTPLAAIVGAAGALKDLSNSLNNKAKADCGATISKSSERLNRFIANLLDMTKLEAGSFKPNTALHDLGEIVGTALERTSKLLARHKIELEMSAELPMLELDPVLFEQVLVNLLDNAAQYAPPDTTLRIVGWREGDAVKLGVADEGSGNPAGRTRTHLRKVPPGEKGKSGASRGPGSALPFRAALSKRWADRSSLRTAPIAPAPSLPSPCLSPRMRRI